MPGHHVGVDHAELDRTQIAGKPGERAVWMIRPATTHYSEVAHLALSGAPGGLRYFIPYRVTLSPAPSRAVAYALRFLRSGEDGTPLWDEYLSRAIDLRGGPAAVVGVNSLGGDWVYVVVEPPAEPTTFRIAIGWSRRGSNDRVQAGAGSGGIRIK